MRNHRTCLYVLNYMMVFVLTNSLLTWEERGSVLHQEIYSTWKPCTKFSDYLKAHFKTDQSYLDLYIWSLA